ncbi:uncharacterized protein M6B38_305805 [Iris pallida]|uniref:Uncharacterized protein n=1 Tax=Iris pallida TaxID=29817 RepID=A0AAX6HKW1_IRIPA|nr:uncharacterized protein M6B38_305805 [Iris pallida]
MHFKVQSVSTHFIPFRLHLYFLNPVSDTPDTKSNHVSVSTSQHGQYIDTPSPDSSTPPLPGRAVDPHLHLIAGQTSLSSPYRCSPQTHINSLPCRSRPTPPVAALHIDPATRSGRTRSGKPPFQSPSTDFLLRLDPDSRLPLATDHRHSGQPSRPHSSPLLFLLRRLLMATSYRLLLRPPDLAILDLDPKSPPPTGIIATLHDSHPAAYTPYTTANASIPPPPRTPSTRPYRFPTATKRKEKRRERPHHRNHSLPSSTPPYLVMPLLLRSCDCAPVPIRPLGAAHPDPAPSSGLRRRRAPAVDPGPSDPSRHAIPCRGCCRSGAETPAPVRSHLAGRPAFLRPQLVEHILRHQLGGVKAEHSLLHCTHHPELHTTSYLGLFKTSMKSLQQSAILSTHPFRVFSMKSLQQSTVYIEQRSCKVPLQFPI